MAYVQVALGEPALENIRLITFSEDNADGDLGGKRVVGSVESHGDNGIAAKSRAEVRAQPRLDGRSLFAKSLPSFHHCNIRRLPDCRKPANRLGTSSSGSDPREQPHPGSECNRLITPIEVILI